MEKRIVGEFEEICSMKIGSKEILLCENKNIKEGGRYMCCYCEASELFNLYNEGFVSDNYAEVVKLYAERISTEAEDMLFEMELDGIMVDDDRELTEDDCHPIGEDKSILGEVVVINGDVLRPEYKRASHQLLFVTGGFGANANSRGRKVYTVNLLNGNQNVFYRGDVLGIVNKDELPYWALESYDKIIKPKDRGER